MIEGLSIKIQRTWYSARGYRDREAFKWAIYFHHGALDLETCRTRANLLQTPEKAVKYATSAQARCA
jgi:hypothetical protein